MICEDKRAPTCNHAVWVHEYEMYVCGRENRGCKYAVKDGVTLEEVFRRGEEQEGWHLYTEYRGDKPVAYRYGPEWVATQLFVDGGYKTPEEAKLRWLEYWEGKK